MIGSAISSFLLLWVDSIFCGAVMEATAVFPRLAFVVCGAHVAEMKPRVSHMLNVSSSIKLLYLLLFHLFIWGF